jgi:hypothetical protein
VAFFSELGSQKREECWRRVALAVQPRPAAAGAASFRFLACFLGSLAGFFFNERTVGTARLAARYSIHACLSSGNVCCPQEPVMLRESHQVSEELEHAINDPNADMPMMAFIPAHMLAADDDAHASLTSHSNRREARTAAERCAARDRWHRVYAEARRVLIARNVIRPLVRNHSAVDSIHASLQVRFGSPLSVCLGSPASCEKSAIIIVLFLLFSPVKYGATLQICSVKAAAISNSVFTLYTFLGGTRGAQVAKRSADVLVLPDPHTRLTTRERAWSTLNDPGFSALAQYWSIFILVTIVFSCSAFVVQSMPQHESSTHAFWEIQVLFRVGQNESTLFYPLPIPYSSSHVVIVTLWRAGNGVHHHLYRRIPRAPVRVPEPLALCL